MSVTHPADVKVPGDIMVDLETLGSGPAFSRPDPSGTAVDPLTALMSVAARLGREALEAEPAAKGTGS